MCSTADFLSVTLAAAKSRLSFSSIAICSIVALALDASDARKVPTCTEFFNEIRDAGVTQVRGWGLGVGEVGLRVRARGKGSAEYADSLPTSHLWSELAGKNDVRS